MRFRRMQKPEIETAGRFGGQSIMQACFVVVPVGRQFELVGFGLRGQQRIRLRALIVSGQTLPIDHGTDTTTSMPVSTIVLT